MAEEEGKDPPEEGNDNKGSSSSNDDDNANDNKGKKISLPTGFRFAPTNEELVRYYLLPRLQRRPAVPNDAIIEANVYLCHPDRLIDAYRDRGEDSWYFLSPRARKYTNGDRPSRHTEDGLGRWKASTGKSEEKGTVVLSDAGGRRTKFCHRVLAYHAGPIKTETKTKWLMQEITIPAFEKKVGEPCSNPNSTLDEFVMCKIYVTPKKPKNDDEAGPSGLSNEEKYPSPAAVAAGTSSKVSEKQAAGKRSVGETAPTVPGGAPKKRARQQQQQHNQAAPSRVAAAGPPAPLLLHGGGTQAPTSRTTAAACYVRPTAYDLRAPIMLTPRPLAYQRPPAPGHCMPPVVYNDGMRMPVQQQPMAYNGQARPQVQRPQMVAYNNVQAQPPVQLQRPQTVAYNNGQVRPPVQRPQTVAYHNVQARPPVQRPQTAAYNGQVRPPVQVQRPQTVACNNGQVRPPVQRPQTAAYNNGMQVRPPVQQPQTVAHNGQVRPPVQRPQTAAYNNGMQVRPPVQRPQTAAYNNGMQARPPMQRPQTVPSNNGMQARPPVQRPQTMPSNNGQARPPMQRPQTTVPHNGMQARPPAASVVQPSPPYQAANAPASPHGHDMPTMWRRPSNPSGDQAVKPPSSVDPRPPPIRREQPETDEQLKERVYRQHVEEWARMTSKELGIEAYTAGGQQPYVGAAGVNNTHHAPAMAPPDDHLSSPYSLYSTGGPGLAGQQSQLCCAVPATSGSGGEAAASPPRDSVSGTGDGGGSGERDMSSCYDENENAFVESVIVDTSPDGKTSADGDGPKQ